MKKTDIMKKIEEKDIKILRLLYIDNDGMIRGYTSQQDTMEKVLDNGYCIASGMPYFTAHDTLVEDSELGPVGEFRIVPDMSTFKILPYAQKSAAVITDIKTQKFDESEVCSRSSLKRIIENSPFEAYASFENEFYLLKENENGEIVPADSSLCYTSRGMDVQNEISLDIIEALDQQDIVVEKYHPEYGPGQQEYCLKYSPVLQMADKQVFFRDTVRAIAESHDLIASFMPKPFEQYAGCGSHINFSLWRNGQNVFYDGDDRHGLSEVAYNFIGGLLKHIDSVCAFTASTVNSYKRLVPHAWASAYGCYGFNNREAAVRLPSTHFHSHTSSKDSVRLEFKPADPTCNPYLALSAITAAGLDGVKNNIDPGAPVKIEPGKMSQKEREEKGITSLPNSLNEAINALEKNDYFRKMFGDKMIDEYVAMKRQDWSDFMGHVSKWEFDKYFDIF